MASLFKTMSPESLTLDDALRLLSLPRLVGSYEETNADTGEVSEAKVEANNGRYGPYLTKTAADGKTETRSLGSEDEIFTVDIDKAKELFAQPKYGRGRKTAATAKKTTKAAKSTSAKTPSKTSASKSSTAKKTTTRKTAAKKTAE